MAKITGLGQKLYVQGVDLSGDITALDEIVGSLEELDCTGINKSARERLGGVRDGMISATTWWNSAVAGTHDTLAALPTTDVHAMYVMGSAIGDPAACLVAKQANYAPSRGDGGSMTAGTELKANAYGLEWGALLTAGTRTDTTATNGTALDYGATIGATTFGYQAYLQVLAFTGTSCTVAIQHSSDNSTFNTFASGNFTAATAVGAERVFRLSGVTVERYVRIATSGTFTNCQFVVAFVKNLTATSF